MAICWVDAASGRKVATNGAGGRRKVLEMPPVGLFVGLSTLDLVWRVNGYPQQNSKNEVMERAVFAGGPAANAAVVFAALGGRARLYTALGRHPLAAMARADLEAQGVEVVDALPDRDGLPAMASILVSHPGGDRTVVSTAAQGLPDVEFDVGRMPEEAAVTVLDGHLREASLGAARSARAAGIPVVLDAGTWKDRFVELLPLADVVICSESFFPPGVRDHAGVLRYLKEAGVPFRAISRGGDPVLWEGPNGCGETPVERIQAVDTLGAGDFFHGAFAFALADGERFAESLELAARVATRSCLEFGTRSCLAALRGSGVVR
jgi:sugar/nucleoside kinase (ribokinase family)